MNETELIEEIAEYLGIDPILIDIAIESVEGDEVVISVTIPEMSVDKLLDLVKQPSKPGLLRYVTQVILRSSPSRSLRTTAGLSLIALMMMSLISNAL